MNDELKEFIGQKMGEVTMQWEPIPSGVFKSQRAVKILDEILEAVNTYITSQVSEQVERAKIKWLDEQVAHVLFDIYPEEVFTPSTAEDKKRVAEIDQDFVTRLHCDGIRHGLHILRREVRGLSARDDLAALHKQSSKLNTPKE